MVQVLDNLKQPLLKLIEKELVCVRLMEGTSNCTFFSQIYPVVMIPSIYIIGHKGLLVEVIAGSVSEDVFQEKIEKSMSINKAEISKTRLDQVKNEESETAKSASSSPNTVLDSDDNQASTSSPIDSAQDFNNKLERAKGLIEEIRVKKAKEEDEKIRKQEEERIRMGKELSQAKIKKQELELQQLIKDREQDKKEEKLARERVLAQIAADREERRKRNTTINLEGQSCSLRPRKTAKIDQTPSVSNSNEAKIQFRFPDGSTITNIFSADEQLRKIYHFVTENSDYRNFELSTTFPKQVFTSTQMSQNLRELGLVPNSVLLVISSSPSTTSLRSIAPVGMFSNVLSYIYSPFAQLWSLLLHYSVSFFAAIAPNTDPATPQQEDLSNVAKQNRLNKKAKKSKYLNKDGNIARLHDNRFKDDDDDENTWNGNSTQQM